MDSVDVKKKKGRALLASVQLPGISDAEHTSSIDELARLVNTLGFEVVGRISQKRKSPSLSTIVGEGKLLELAKWTGGTGVVEGFSKKSSKKAKEADAAAEEEAELAAAMVEEEEEEAEEGDAAADAPIDPKNRATIIVFDLEMSPTQLRNLEQATGVEILDRSGVILEIFSRHARSREAKLQVEIAKLGYMAPRLRALSVGGDREGGGVGGRGKGETTHELDRRRIRDRIAELRSQLNVIRGEQQTRRAHRTETLSVALVGYTNAGKSSLMRALTGSEVLVADKLFATLDTTVRALQPESVPRILVSDTVGFIKKLPHDLVASFRSTLDEAQAASLLFFTVDASDPSFRSQLEVTKTVLSEIDAGDIPSKLILNKVDRLDAGQLKALKAEFPDAIYISAHNPDDVKRVKEIIRNFFEQDMNEVEIFLPYAKMNLIGMIRESVRVVSEVGEEEGTRIKIRGYPGAVEKIKKALK
jgi:GTP-binding protein HflX